MRKSAKLKEDKYEKTITMKKRNLIILSTITGVFMAVAWAGVMSLGFLMLVAFVPLLFIEDYVANSKDKKFHPTATFCYTYPAFLIFAFANTYWISNASPIGYVVPIAEAAFMSIVFQLYSFSKKVASQKQGAYFFLIIYWVAFEHIQFFWDINFPWLNLGNSFASYPILVQWYSVLGMEGGTLWILITNILIYLFVKRMFNTNIYFRDIIKENEIEAEENVRDNAFKRVVLKYKYQILVVLVVVAPIVWSLVLYYTYEDESKQSAKVLIVQPNLDPYNEQYNLEPSEIIQRVKDIAQPHLTDKIDFLVLPESCIQEYAWEDLLDGVPSVLDLKNFVGNTNCEVIAGISTRKLLPEGVKTAAARELRGVNNQYYESCNTGIMFNKNSVQNDIQLRHKSVLVVGVEKLPFTKYLPFIEKLALDMGGTVGTLGVDEKVNNFYSQNRQISIGVPICWESVDGNYTRKFVKNGANFLQIITNVGWWGDTPGYKQYFAISSLRAIENRRYVSVCANTGYSGLINAKGQTVDKGPYWEQKAFVYDVPLLDKQTFFSLNGDMLMRPFTFFAVLLLLYSVVRNKTKVKEKVK